MKRISKLKLFTSIRKVHIQGVYKIDNTDTISHIFSTLGVDREYRKGGYELILISIQKDIFLVKVGNTSIIPTYIKRIYSTYLKLEVGKWYKVKFYLFKDTNPQTVDRRSFIYFTHKLPTILMECLNQDLCTWDYAIKMNKAELVTYLV